MSRARRLAAVAGVAVLIAAGAACRTDRRKAALPERIRLDRVVDDLAARFEPASVAAEPAPGAVRRAWLYPTRSDGAVGAVRLGVLAPPPAALRYRVRVPPAGAALDLEMTAGPGDGPEDLPGPVRFTVAVDGRQVFAEVLEPARRGRDGRWHDARVELDGVAAGDVDVVLSTRALDPAHPAPKAGWGRARLVRADWRARQEATAQAPSVLVLLVDTLRADRLGCYGAAPTSSPTLDALAGRGTLFTDAVAQASWTMPSVATLFTGLWPQHHGVVGGEWRKDSAGGAERYHLGVAVPTLAALAQEVGLSTVGFAANGIVSRETGLGRGFERWYHLTGDPTGTRFARAGEVNGRFLGWLDANPGVRFLGYLHYMDVHAPYEPPPEFRPSGMTVGSATLPRAEGAPAQDQPLAPAAVADLRALYDASIRYWDSELGRLLQGLEERGVAASTVVVVTADHGEAFQEHGYLGHCVHLHEELLRVPLVVAGPGVPAGRRIAGAAQGLDFLPTVAALLGVPAPDGLPGRDLLRQPPADAAIVDTRLWKAPDGRRERLVALRTARWKLMHAPALGSYELYDLVDDPAERRNRFAEVDDGGALATLLQRAIAAEPPLVGTAVPDAGLRSRLRALGYVD